MAKRLKVNDQIRRLVATCGVSRADISRDTGIPESALSRFMAGERGLSAKVLDRLGNYLDLEIVMHGPKR